jgi:DNA polymerase III epsilon subunit-like protein
MARKINNLLRFDNNKKWLIFDFETEDLNLFSSRPWQLSYCVYQGNEKIEEYDRFPFWPDLKMSADAARITGFIYGEYKQKSEDPNEVLGHFEKYLFDKDILISGANLIGFDIFIHNTFRRSLGKQSDYSYIERIYDVQNIEKAIEIGYQKPEGQSQTSWNFKLKSFNRKGLKTSVEYLCKKYSIPYDKSLAHNGLYDVGLTYQILKKQLYLLNQ